MATLVEAYEAKRYAIGPPDLVQAINFRMNQLGITGQDLETQLGGRRRVFKILTEKRGPSLKMSRRLNRTLHIPLESLIGTAV